MWFHFIWRIHNDIFMYGRQQTANNKRCVVITVCERKRGRERKRGKGPYILYMWIYFFPVRMCMFQLLWVPSSNVVNQISQIKSSCETVKQFICKIYVFYSSFILCWLLLLLLLLFCFFVCRSPFAVCHSTAAFVSSSFYRICFLFLSVFRGPVQIKPKPFFSIFFFGFYVSVRALF